MSNLKVVPITSGSKMPDDIVPKLHQLIADIEAGNVTAMVIAAVIDGEYVTMYPASWNESLVLSTLLQRRAVDHFFAG